MHELDPGALWQRLKHDVVFRAGTLYAGASWFLVEALDTLQLPAALIRGTALGLALLFVPVLGAAVYWRRRNAARASDSGMPALPGDAAAAGANTLAAAAVAPGAGAASAASAGRPAPKRPRTGTLRWGVATGSLVVLALGLWAFGARPAGGEVPAAAERIAVLPFYATGSDEVREFGRGMVDLLTAALSDVGPIRTVASRSVLARVGADGSALSPDEAMGAARALGAGSVLTGSITAFGDDVRILAELRDVVSGEVMASADVRGARNNIMTLTDRVAAALLRDLWRSRTPIPSIRTAALTSDIPAALRAWLAGEQHLRAFRYDSAVHHFGAAVEADSTFALAWARLAEATGWQNEPDARQRRRALYQRAVSLADRLPARDLSLLHAFYLHLEGKFEAFDSLRSYVNRYPDDPLGWYYLGDARFHAMFLGRFDDDEIMQPFFEALRLDPTFGVGVVHLLDMAVYRNDRALFDSIMPTIRRHGDSRLSEDWERRARIRWEAHPDSLLNVFAREVRALDPVRQRAVSANLLGTLSGRVRHDIDVDPRIYIAAVDTLLAVVPGNRDFRRIMYWNRAQGRFNVGRRSEAHEDLERWMDHVDIPSRLPRDVFRARRRIQVSDEHYIPMELLAADAAVLEALPDTSFDRNPLIIYYTLAGRAQEAREQARRTRRKGPPPANGMNADDLFDMNDAWGEVMLGDTARSLPRLEAAIRRIGYEDLNTTPGMMWDDVGRLLGRIPGREAEGVRMIRNHIRLKIRAPGVLYLEIGRILERTGDRAGAREAYAHALRFLQHGESYQRGNVEEARAALARLSREPVR
jgi:TolB-like protein/tetratricopeptide (TPR) repeat protein